MWFPDYARTVSGAMIDDAAWFATEHGAWPITGAEPGPVWDGEGTDPWLVPRMDAAAEAAVIEAAIREAVWVELSAWLVTVSRAVLHTALPDPLAVFSKSPAWAAAVDRVVRGPVRDAVGTTYQTLLGDGYRFGSRPAVVEHLATVSNRMVRTVDSTFDLVARQVSIGANLGEGAAEIADRVDEVLSTTRTERWPNRATVIARTETMGALNAGRQDAFAAVAEELATPFEQMWVATVDRRVRPTHRRADGQRVPTGQPFVVGGASLRFPGDPLGPGKEVIQCLPGDVVVDYRAVRSVTRRWYEGDVVVIRFAGGNNLTITPNHPVLRADGVWVAAGLINEGDHCVRCDIRRGDSGTPDEDGGPSKIGEIYGTACEAKTPDRIPLSPPDFHGDSTDGDVEVVPIYGNLRFDGYPARDEEIDEFGLSLADFACSRGRRADGRTFTVGVPLREVDVQPPSFGVRWCHEETSGFDAGATHSDLVGFASGSGVQSGYCESTDDGWPAHSKSFGDREDAVSVVVSGDDVVNVDVDSFGESGRFGRGSDSGAAGPEIFGDGVRGAIQESCEFDGARPVFVSMSEVVSVDRFSFAGHVFNLDTGVGWYTANCIPVRNCRCTTILLEPGETVDLTHRQFKNY